MPETALQDLGHREIAKLRKKLALRPPRELKPRTENQRFKFERTMDNHRKFVDRLTIALAQLREPARNDQ